MQYLIHQSYKDDQKKVDTHRKICYPVITTKGDAYMTGKEALRYAVNEKRLTQHEIAKRAGYIRQTNVSEILRSSNARIDNVVRVLNACGYDLVMIDREHPDQRVMIESGHETEGDKETDCHE